MIDSRKLKAGLDCIKYVSGYAKPLKFSSLVHDFICKTNNHFFFLDVFEQNGTGEEDLFHAATSSDSDSVVLAGYTFGNWDDEAKGGDFAAVKLDSQGTELWRWQVREPSLSSRLTVSYPSGTTQKMRDMV